MNRFTKELWDGCPIEEWSHFVELDGNETKVLGEGWAHPVVVGGVIDRLAAYEDSGLSPEEVQELAKAKADGRLVEMPPDGQIYHIEEIKETGERWIGNKPCQHIQGDGYYCGWGLAAICFPFSGIGKTVFLTREAAEKALGVGE